MLLSAVEGGESNCITAAERLKTWAAVTDRWVSVCASSADQEQEDELELNDKMKAELARQISVDVHRSYNFLDGQIALEDKPRRRKLLERFLNRTFNVCRRADTHYELEYLQGAHEVCAVLLDLYIEANQTTDKEENVASELQEDRPLELSDTFVRLVHDMFISRLTCFHTRLSLDIGIYMTFSLILEIVKKHSPNCFRSLCLAKHGKYSQTWEGDGSEIYFAIPWLVTLFAHSIQNQDLVIRIWDTLICLPPPFLVYFVASMVEQCEPILEQIQDNHNHINLDADTVFLQVFPRAVEMLEQYPYDCLYMNVMESITRVCRDGENYFDAQETVYTHLAPQSVPFALWAPVLETWREPPASAAATSSSSPASAAETKCGGTHRPRGGVVLGTRVSARVVDLAGVDGWYAKVRNISREIF